jgi:hypothetical protein
MLLRLNPSFAELFTRVREFAGIFLVILNIEQFVEEVILSQEVHA